MDNQVVSYVVAAILGACVLFLIYMAARAAAYDGIKDYMDEKEGKHDPPVKPGRS